MKTLSIHGNYILDILAGRKTQEFRSWKTNHRGPLLLASTVNTQARPTLPGYLLAVVDVVSIEGGPGDYAWNLENPRAITPVKNKGQLQLYERGDDLITYRPDLDQLTTEKYIQQMQREGFEVVTGTSRKRKKKNSVTMTKEKPFKYYDNGFLKF
jgi:hypothetical protein